MWDVAWAPAGHYFGSAGADRAARVWCTEVPLEFNRNPNDEQGFLRWVPLMMLNVI